MERSPERKKGRKQSKPAPPPPPALTKHEDSGNSSCDGEVGTLQYILEYILVHLILVCTFDFSTFNFQSEK